MPVCRLLAQFTLVEGIVRYDSQSVNGRNRSKSAQLTPLVDVQVNFCPNDVRETAIPTTVLRFCTTKERICRIVPEQAVWC